MSDFFVNLAKNPTARSVVRTLGLPVPMPQDLLRAEGPWSERPLEGATVLAGHLEAGELAPVLAPCLIGTGAALTVAASEDQAKPYRETGAQAGRAPAFLTTPTPSPDFKPRALVFDATGIKTAQDLRAVYAFFQPYVRALKPCGRMIVVGRPPAEQKTPEAAAAARALEGFIRSAAREIGRKGSTAQTVYVAQGAEDRLEPVLRFLLSPNAAYISGQPLHVSAAVPCDLPVPQVKPLEGKTALVTGAARGIGEATARTLAREGAHVVCVDRPAESEALDKVAGAISGSAFACDITDPDAPQKVAEYLKKDFDGLDVAVHNAGVTRDKTLGNMDAERWDMVMNVNLIGLIALNEALVPILREGGRIICLSSVGGISGNAGQTNYAASKAGVIGYVQGLAPTLAGKGVAVNAIAPGFIETAMTAAMPFGTREVARRLCNLGQGGQPGDVAEAITFLATPGAAGMTGQVLRVCGGNYVGA